MKKIRRLRLLLILLFLNIHFSGFSQPDYFKTEYNSGIVTINTIIPNANTVKIVGMGGSWGLNNLNKNFINSGDSAWQVILDPAEISYLTPGFHYYNFQVNGVKTSNPNERVYFGAGYWNSAIDIPDTGGSFYEIKDVPHGTIRMQLYFSTTTKTYRMCFIYLPPDYDTRNEEKYPVLFLQHGMNENEYSWHMNGKMNFILDNLISEGKALPMIVVMDNGMTVSDYTSLVLNDLIPLLENSYKIKTGKMNMAVAGLSMGSYQASDLGFGNLGKFAYVGVFSGGTDMPLYSLYSKINDSIEVLFNGYGSTDELNLGESFESSLNSSKTNHINAIYPGGHEWQVWRKCLNQFAQLLFKPYTYDHPFSVSNIKSENSFSAYPNPFNEQIHLQCDDDAGLMDANYRLIDITGKQILSYTGNKSIAEKEIAGILQSSSGGLFILSVNTRTNIYQAKIIK